MPSFSATSLGKLQSCDARLQRLFLEVVQGFDCTILEGHRGQEEQDRAFFAGKSKLKWPLGKHNSLPSKAVDVAPYPLSWTDTPRFYLFAGYVLAIARMLGIGVRWGGDWDRDLITNDNKFDDLVHFELI